MPLQLKCLPSSNILDRITFSTAYWREIADFIIFDFVDCRFRRFSMRVFFRFSLFAKFSLRFSASISIISAAPSLVFGTSPAFSLTMALFFSSIGDTLSCQYKHISILATCSFLVSMAMIFLLDFKLHNYRLSSLYHYQTALLFEYFEMLCCYMPCLWHQLLRHFESDSVRYVRREIAVRGKYFISSHYYSRNWCLHRSFAERGLFHRLFSRRNEIKDGMKKLLSVVKHFASFFK